MRTIYLSNTTGTVFKILSYIAIIVLDTIQILLTPFTWIKLKGHITMIVFTVLCGGTMYFFTQDVSVIHTALFSLFAAIVFIMLSKALHKAINVIRKPLTRIIYSPVGVYINIRYLFPKKQG